MAVYSITIPTNEVQDWIDAWGDGWTSETGITKAQYAKQSILSTLKSNVRSFRERKLAEAASNSSATIA
ncbi:MAG: hypothetical protein A2Z42_04210 [Candidatus Woykebacteria bacterium RBG_19FT_COMBO_43_10]|uniref:Uncharacterized protein n=1 Tax=Candidatus Woykebacteria bacterium RBG_19FT_COMBO_43_10 TaxID=1802598 RepID=A0A1G1WKL2_9BACT|nr:MAG: hypothetical protein A2Z42_04210 [Candidatus Woykebacteria bacterium RBG_19FT_COMBO_43_10]